VYAARHPWFDRIALLGGAAVAAIALLGWRVEGGSQASPASVAIVASSSSDVAVEQPDGSVDAVELRPSEPSGGVERVLTVTNATGAPLAFRVKAEPQAHDLDEILTVRVRIGEAAVYEGDLGGLAQGSAPFALASHESADLSVAAWIPMDAGDGWQARSVEVPLTFQTTQAAMP
jgi:hypothetical protein